MRLVGHPRTSTYRRTFCFSPFSASFLLYLSLHRFCPLPLLVCSCFLLAAFTLRSPGWIFAPLLAAFFVLSTLLRLPSPLNVLLYRGCVPASSVQLWFDTAPAFQWLLRRAGLSLSFRLLPTSCDRAFASHVFGFHRFPILPVSPSFELSGTHVGIRHRRPSDRCSAGVLQRSSWSRDRRVVQPLPLEYAPLPGRLVLALPGSPYRFLYGH